MPAADGLAPQAEHEVEALFDDVQNDAAAAACGSFVPMTLPPSDVKPIPESAYAMTAQCGESRTPSFSSPTAASELPCGALLALPLHQAAVRTIFALPYHTIPYTMTII